MGSFFGERRVEETWSFIFKPLPSSRKISINSARELCTACRATLILHQRCTCSGTRRKEADWTQCYIQPSVISITDNPSTTPRRSMLRLQISFSILKSEASAASFDSAITKTVWVLISDSNISDHHLNDTTLRQCFRSTYLDYIETCSDLEPPFS